jgi:hypothetical protein
MAKGRPKTGEARETHQPLKIDRLPHAVHDAILALRNGVGLTWAQLEERSSRPFSPDWREDGGGFVDWDALETHVLELFPEMRLPRVTLHRWYDLRVSQARQDVLEDGNTAQQFIEKLGELKIEGMNDAVMHAMTREVFGLLKSTSELDRVKLVSALNDTSLVLTRLQKLQLQQKKAEAEIAKSEADKARFQAEAGDPRAIYLQAAQDILKKLQTRKPVRLVLEPIQAELINEIAHGADAFAKQVEQATA